ncbi:MAG: biotin/lipoyl-containing protein, partial [Acidimicrobiales bacterium]
MTTTIDYVMPSLGADMDAGTVTEWLINAGDEVTRGDVVAVVETDKADIDIEVWQTGTVVEILVPPGNSVPVGTPLARLAITDGEATADRTEPMSSPPVPAEPAPGPPPTSAAVPAAVTGAVPAAV